MLRVGAGRSEVRIVGDQVGCPTYAQDIAKAIMTILEALKQKKCLHVSIIIRVIFAALVLSFIKLFLMKRWSLKLLRVILILSP